MASDPGAKRIARAAAVLGSLALASAAARAGAVAARPGVYESWTERVPLSAGGLDLTCVKPLKPRSPAFLVLFATGDAGWMGTSGRIFQHLADQGTYLAAADSRDIIKPLKRSGSLVPIADAASAVEAMMTQARRALELPETTPVIVTGFSRGANLVVLAAGVESLQHHVGGALAIALTREADFLQAPPPAERSASLQVDDKGRIQTYPAIALAGAIPFAVIQAKGDRYVPAEEARRLFGPDSATRRLYEVDSGSHGFGGAREELLRDLDDALGWIESTAAGGRSGGPVSR
jgi:type IV secretory pathway VirJ component